MLVFVGLSHRTAPIEVRERLALSKDLQADLLDRLRSSDAIGEACVLSTCNRVEVYAALPRHVEQGPEALTRAARVVGGALTEIGGPDVDRALVTHAGFEALRHLYRVASSLDSLVVGEPQILGQLKEAVAFATDRGALGRTLGRAMHRALFVGKRVRTETGIGEGQVSVASIAVDLACEIFGDVSGKAALLVGAGDMAEGAAKLLVKEGVRLIVVNRSFERAERLAREVGGEAKEWGELNWCLVEADIVVSSTASPDYVITRAGMKSIRKARRGRAIFFIDIAVPRDVEPSVNELDDVYLYDIDDLEQIADSSQKSREAEAHKAEAIVEAEVAAFETWRVERSMAPAIVGLRARVKATLVSELERSLSHKLRHLGEEDKRALAAMVEAATNKLCHRPSTRLKQLAADSRGVDALDVLTDLFDLPKLSEEPDEPLAEERAHEDERHAQEKEPS